MPLRTIKVPSPIGGVNRALARTQQPGISSNQGLPTCWDALNVVPYDRYGRLRVSERSGTTPLWATPLGDGTQNVQLLEQVTTIASVAVGSQYAFDYSLTDDSVAVPWTGNSRIDTASASSTHPWDFGSSSSAPSIAVWDGIVSTLTPMPNTATITGNPMRFVDSTSAMVMMPGGAGNVNQTVAARQHTGLPAAANTTITMRPVSGGSATAIYFLSMIEGITGATLAANLHLKVDIAAGTVTLYQGVTQRGIASPAVSLDQQIWFMSRNGNSVIVAHGTSVDPTLATTDISVNLSGLVPTNGFWVAFGGGFTSNVGSMSINVSSEASIARETPSAVIKAGDRITSIIAVCGGNIYTGNLTTQGVVASNGTGALDATVLPSGAAIFGNMYFCDGYSDLKVLNVATKVVTTFSPTAGTETATTLGKYRFAGVYRGRLVLASSLTSPQNFVCSRVGVPTDFDYSQNDPAAAFAGNAAQNGQIGEPISAIMPFTDDMMGIGGDHNLYMMRGDPAANGAIDNISDQIGIIGKKAWCRAPDGMIYFVGTGGFYKWDAQSAPQSIADTTFNQFFANINRATSIVQVVWDRDRRGCFIFITSVTTGLSTHVWFDARTGGTYWPMQYPNSFGPISSLVFDGDGPTDRRILLGTRDGKLLQWQDNSRSDNDNGVGTAINAYVVLGPFHPAPDAAKLIGTTFEFGELAPADQIEQIRWQANVTLNAGVSAYDVTEGTPQQTATIFVGRDRRSKTFRQRLRGEWFSIKVSNNFSAQYFVLDDLTLEFDTAGKERRQR